VKVEISLESSGAQANSLEMDLKQALADLGLTGKISIDRDD
jgi:hypothetical protein